MAKETSKSIKERVVEAALELAEEKGWANVGLPDVAERCGITLAALFDVIEDKDDILVLFGRMIDRRVLEGVGEMGEGPDEAVSARDLLFDLLMERFDILNEYRAGLVSVLESFRFDPKQAVISCPHLCRSMAWMLEACSIDTRGVCGAVKVAGLTGVYLKTLRVWKDDGSVDLGKTMAALDRDLGRAEKFANTFGV